MVNLLMMMMMMMMVMMMMMMMMMTGDDDASPFASTCRDVGPPPSQSNACPTSSFFDRLLETSQADGVEERKDRGRGRHDATDTVGG
jgi:hypothetical protein